MKNASRIVTIVFGALAAMAGLEHGIRHRGAGLVMVTIMCAFATLAPSIITGFARDARPIIPVSPAA